MFGGQRIVLIIPALDEEAALPAVLRAVPESVDRTIVADNGSRDGTARVAERCGAEVVHEARRGYGSACLAGIHAGPEADIFVFMDGDGSDDPAEIPALLSPITEAGADLVIGSRGLGGAESGALTAVQVFGNRLTCFLLRLFWHVRATDLGPFRAIRGPALERLGMSDPDFGWTIEMQVKAAQFRLNVAEISVRRRARQAGRSKVSGDLRASFLAGKRILGYVLRAKLREILGPPSSPPNIPRRRNHEKPRSP
jgi:glycosyltransferase involved in cell wall biosynthesis